MNPYTLEYKTETAQVVQQIVALGTAVADKLPTHLVAACQKMRLTHEHNVLLRLANRGQTRDQLVLMTYRNNIVYYMIRNDVDCGFIQFLIEDLGWVISFDCMNQAIMSGRLDVAEYVYHKGTTPAPNFNTLSFAAAAGNLDAVKWVIDKLKHKDKQSEWPIAEAARYGHYDCLVYLREYTDVCAHSSFAYQLPIMSYFKTGDLNVARCIEYLLASEKTPHVVADAMTSDALASCVCCCFYVARPIEQYTKRHPSRLNLSMTDPATHKSYCALVNCHPRLRYLFDMLGRYVDQHFTTSDGRIKFYRKLYERCFRYGNYCALVILNQDYMLLQTIVADCGNFKKIMSLASRADTSGGMAWLANYEFLLGHAGFKSLDPDPASGTTLSEIIDSDMFMFVITRSQNRNDIAESYAVWGRAVLLAQYYGLLDCLEYLCSLKIPALAERQKNARLLLADVVRATKK